MPALSSVVRSPSCSASAIVFPIVVCIVTRSSFSLPPGRIVVQSNHAHKVKLHAYCLFLGAIVGFGAFLGFHSSSSFPVPLLRSFQQPPLLFDPFSVSLHSHNAVAYLSGRVVAQEGGPDPGPTRRL